MALSVQASKFALLPDDDEDLNKKALRNLKNGKVDNKGESNKAKSKPKKKKNKNKNDTSNNSSSVQDNKKTSPETSNDQQFATWLSHDQQATEEAFAQDLQNAILASKVDYVAELKKHQNSPPGMSAKNNKKPAAMTLQAFNNLSLNNGAATSEPTSNSTAVTETENFFEDVEEATKRALNREQVKESLQQRYNVSFKS